MNKCLCIFGFGYTASYLTEILRNDSVSIIGVSRNPDKSSHIKNNSFRSVHFSAKALSECNITPTHILISTPPSEDGDPTLKEFESYIKSIHPTPQSIAYLSTTGVYGDHKGEWVDESSVCHQPGIKGENRLAAEKSWQVFSEKNHIPLFIFRIAGIYGPYRNALHKLINRGSVSIVKNGQFFSRIHVEDLARTIKSGLFQPEKAGIYNVSDNEPTSNTSVDDFAANLLGIPAPTCQSIEEANLSAIALEFYKSNKKVSNTKMKNILGIELKYPSYREGLTSLFNNHQY
jgi:nucleoside-diphosphate-sugar epimerase